MQSLPNEQSHPLHIFESPVEERHLDFLLEEEFACNPEFLQFFIAEAMTGGGTAATFAIPHENWDCRAVRSVTTGKGETDVLVIYTSVGHEQSRVAILIENKIRAGFQKAQAERYRLRGKEGIGKQWDRFWTCLVSPKRYAPHNQDFDAKVSLESLQSYFAGTARRAAFKAAVFRQAILLNAISGVRKVDPHMTEWRAAYAAAAGARFGSEVRWEEARPACDQDKWFCFRSPLLPPGAVITHKAGMGAVHLSLPQLSADKLQDAVRQSGIEGSPQIRQTHKSASFCFSVAKVDFSRAFQQSWSAVDQAFARVSDLLAFWREHGESVRSVLLSTKDPIGSPTSTASVPGRHAAQE